ASPEMLVKVQDRVVYTHPIAGTRKRGATPELDIALGQELLADPKERAEHIMLVDLGRNDANRVCKPETVKVDSLMHLERYSHVMHIVSNVSGTLRDDKTPFDAFRSIFPAGTTSGAPKVRAMELISELERTKRGVYAGAVGHFDYSGGLDTCIALRTMVIKDGVAYLQAGGGIVHDSVEEDEYQETINKLGSNLTALRSSPLANSHIISMAHSITVKPSLEEVQGIIESNAGNTIPIFAEIPADMLTPVMAYLKVSDKCDYSFLLESIAGGEKIGRYSFIGSDPYKVLKTGPEEALQGDPLAILEKELKNIRYVKVKGIQDFTGGAIGYIGYDNVQYFEPRTKRDDLQDPIGLPDAVFLFCDTIVIFDHLYQKIQVVTHYRSNVTDPAEVEKQYFKAVEEIQIIVELLENDVTPKIPQPPIILGQEPVSNVGKEGYEGFVTTLKKHIKLGDIIQAVPSQRLAKPTTLHPFNIYRHLRSINPSPYMFYLDLKDFTL
ncbi:hypothetical protein BGZ80_006777, partial [Entomortierella chlamydospora]